MKKYKCHKEVHATPMTRGAYNLYRGWEIPADEDPSDAGYLVVYDKDTPGHYESWSPKDKFDAGYTELTGVDSVTALADEIADLDGRLNRLSAVLVQQGQKVTLPRDVLSDLFYQEKLMQELSGLLHKRHNQAATKVG
ncbi:MAG: hypothetical protein ACK5LG_21895 [Bacteroides thetaiotaomicron]